MVDDRPLEQHRGGAVVEQQVARQRSGHRAEQRRVADVQDRGEQRQALAPILAEHHVAPLAAADEHEMARRGGAGMVAVEVKLAAGERAARSAPGRRRSCPAPVATATAGSGRPRSSCRGSGSRGGC